MSKVMELIKEMECQVFNAMVILIREKGAENKMISSLDIARYLREKTDYPLPHLFVQATLDNLITNNYIYYKKFEDSGLTFYGIPKNMWEKYKEKEEKDNVRTLN